MNSSIFILILCLSISAVSLAGPDAPIWPQTFSQDFVQGDSKVKTYTTGKLWYDIKNNRQRLDVQKDNYDDLCISIGQDANTRCSQIFVDNNMYVFLPLKNKCCKCCTAEQGCTVESRDWLKDFTYTGEATLSGQSFYKWSFKSGGITENYFATQDDQRVPRRIQAETYGLDYIMNTYSKNSISDSVFNLPSFCSSDCPKQTMCGSYRSGQQKYASLRQAILGKQIVQNKKIKVQEQ